MHRSLPFPVPDPGPVPTGAEAAAPPLHVVTSEAFQTLFFGKHLHS